MSRIVSNPPENGLLPDGSRRGGWWHDDAEEGRIVCDLCPRDCHLRPGDRGFCFVRENRDGEMVLSTYGKSTGFCIDPIEKKPLNQFFPGTSVLSFGTAGCNLGCKFCQNWSISKSKEIERLSEHASPEAIAQAALKLGCRSVAYTYNDPVIWAEYAIDAAKACREVGVKSVAVTAGYITPQARGAFYEYMDAANVDLKAFTEDFYRHVTLSHLEPVKETLRWLVHETDVWTEITNLIIPRENDSADELKAMCDWILEALGPDVPVHFTAFHPDFRMQDTEHTPPETLLRAYDIASAAGLNYFYVGNIQSPKQQSTYCPSCRQSLIERVGYTITRYDLAGNECRHCGTRIAGHYDAAPGTWGARRQPVRISQFDVRPAPEYGITTRQVPLTITAAPPPERPMATTTAQVPAAAPAAAIGPLTSQQEQAIAKSAARILAAATEGYDLEPTAADYAGTAGAPVLGAFVSAKRGGRLRGCCGFLGQSVPLASAIAHAARRTANDDHRFPPITQREVPHLDLEVWLLSNQQAVSAEGESRRDIVKIGKHGLQIARGESRGLLLPGVAVDAGLDAEGFLEQVCLKAGLPPTAWREADTALWTFEGHVIKAAAKDLLAEHAPAAASPFGFSQPAIVALGEFCRQNLLAICSGATPNYFAPGLPDGNVHGIVLSLIDASGREILQANRLGFRDSMPLQSTLFGMTESLAPAIAQMRIPLNQLRTMNVGITVVAQPAIQGVAAEPDLRGIDAARHMIVVMERNRTAALFDPQKKAAELVAAATTAAGITQPQYAQVLAMECLSGLSRVQVVSIPQSTRGQEVRPAGVAGRFYPADSQQLSDLVDRCFPANKPAAEAWPAVMLPHAGLVYSGRVAGETLARVRIPSTVIVIGPKHTPHGLEWAVAPQATWSIPGAAISSDPALAQQLCAAIPGLSLDAAAHAQEHAIEVELPLIHRLAPTAKVVGIAIGGGDLARCRQFAAGLAQVIRGMAEPPLLVISSDMNHFASDAENRRLDEIALKAMETLDPEQLFQTVTSQHISMCGLLPAIIVMETLRELKQLKRVQRVAYATSADVSGDKTRVVGYAGTLLG